jgi:ArsR family transcriptional regulator
MNGRLLPAGCCHPDDPAAPLALEERERLVGIFRALGDGTRLEVFRLVVGATAAVCVCDITDRFAVSQPTISHHLRVLKDAGLITQEKRGVWSFYAATPLGATMLALLPAASAAVDREPVPAG